MQSYDKNGKWRPFGRHLGFCRKLQGDCWGLLVCYFAHIPGHVLKNSACYEIFPGYNQCSWTMKKVCYKVSLCENCQRQSCKAFIGLTNRAKMIGGGDPLYLKFWIKLTALVQNRLFSTYFRSEGLSPNSCVKTVSDKVVRHSSA